MKLSAIYNVWDGVELLAGSINCIKDHVDLIIIVYQPVSNFGEEYNPIDDINEALDSISGLPEIILTQYTIEIEAGALNEKAKRNQGLLISKINNCTHFLHLDCDEYYKDFSEAKKLYIESGSAGSVCKLWTYFKHPTFRLAENEGYFVPFIHKLNDNTVAGKADYPFYVDPTRVINEENVVELPVFMDHFSWVRADIERKIRNSSAKKNLERGTLLKDYYSEALVFHPEGYYIADYDQKITVVENYYQIQI